MHHPEDVWVMSTQPHNSDYRGVNWSIPQSAVTCPSEDTTGIDCLKMMTFSSFQYTPAVSQGGREFTGQHFGMCCNSHSCSPNYKAMYPRLWFPAVSICVSTKMIAKALITFMYLLNQTNLKSVLINVYMNLAKGPFCKMSP